jgi:hypothetical protein
MDLSKINKYEDKASFVEDVRKRAFEMEMNSHGCSQVVVQTFLDVLEEENLPLFMAASPFAAGMSLTGNNCGALIGGLMVLGTEKMSRKGCPESSKVSGPRESW